MKHNITKSIDLLHSLGCSIVACKGEDVYSSSDIGISPILRKLGEDINFFNGYCVADKIIGKAAALLLTLSGAEYVYGEVMSESAMKILQKNNIDFSYGQSVAYIENRTNTGLCPLEQSVLEIDDPNDGFIAVKAKVMELRKK